MSDQDESSVDYTAAILKSPDQLMVDQATNDNNRSKSWAANDNNSAVFMNPEKMEHLQVLCGDTILIRGENNRDTICRVLSDETCEVLKMKMNKVVRFNLRVYLGDVVSVHPRPYFKHGKRLHISPLGGPIVSGDFTKAFLKPYFLEAEAYRTVKKGDIFPVRIGMEFKVMETDPAGEYCLVTPDTEIICDGEKHLEREEEERRLQQAWYENVGGLRDQILYIRELVEIPLKHPQIFKPLVKGILLSGPPGSGKSLIARAVANETGAFFYSMDMSDIVTIPAKCETKLREAFKKAQKNAPSIILIADIISYPRLEMMFLSHLLTLVDGLKQSGAPVIVIGTTSCPSSIHQAMRSRIFDIGFDVGVHDQVGRLEVLRIHTKQIKLSDDVDLKRIAEDTHGYVGADLAYLCADAHRQCFIEMGYHELDDDIIDAEVLSSIVVTNDHLKSVSRRENKLDVL